MYKRCKVHAYKWCYIRNKEKNSQKSRFFKCVETKQIFSSVNSVIYWSRQMAYYQWISERKSVLHPILLSLPSSKRTLVGMRRIRITMGRPD